MHKRRRCRQAVAECTANAVLTRLFAYTKNKTIEAQGLKLAQPSRHTIPPDHAQVQLLNLEYLSTSALSDLGKSPLREYMSLGSPPQGSSARHVHSVETKTPVCNPLMTSPPLARLGRYVICLYTSSEQRTNGICSTLLRTSAEQ